MVCHGQHLGGSEAGAPCFLGEDVGRAHSRCKGPGGSVCWQGRGQPGASVAGEGVSRRGQDPRGRRGRSRRAWRAAASCLNKMQSGGFRERRARLSRAPLALHGSKPTVGGGCREGREEATAVIQVGDKGGLDQLGRWGVLD